VPATPEFLNRAFGLKEKVRHAECMAKPRLAARSQRWGRAHERSLMTSREASAAAMGVFISLDEFDKHCEDVKAAGAEFVYPSEHAPYARNDWANDPEEHPWFFTTPPKTG
jgi:uncharacterized glyoxalase superfamily protein PhnB